MDWKYKHFHQERVFPGSPETVTEAARESVANSLGWTTKGTADGFIAEGTSFGHATRASYGFQSVGQGTKVSIDLLVERAGVTGFMLVDVGGYYNIQIRKWLDGIQWQIHQGDTGASEQTPPPIAPNNKKAARLFNGCMVVVFLILGLWFFGNFISAIVGLVTGNLHLWGKGGTVVLHGMVARATAVVIIMFGLFLAWQLLKSRRHPLRPL